jgi:uncharacterized protein YcgI (DUF1989 family)
MKSITVPFNNQQTAILDACIVRKGLADDLQDLVRRAVREVTSPDNYPPRYSASTEAAPLREVVEEYELQPGTGKAIVVRKGQIIRVQQIEGGQCADFNCYNLHDRNECLHVGRTRSIHGVSPVAGDLLWSKAPWERPIMAIVSSNAVCDTLYPCCSPRLYNFLFDNDRRTNCQQMQEEAQREYGIPPYCVHESFNTFMCVEVAEGGESRIVRNSGKPGDYIDLYALMDVLAVANVCGDDTDRCNNFSLNPVLVQVLSALPSDDERARAAVGRFTPLSSRRHEKVEPTPLVRDPNYVADFPWKPELRAVDVTLSEDESARFEQIRDRDIYGDDDGAALRDMAMSWMLERVHPSAQ